MPERQLSAAHASPTAFAEDTRSHALRAAVGAEACEREGHASTARALWQEASRLSELASEEAPDAATRETMIRAAAAFALRAGDAAGAKLILARRR